jgi:large subunit ribosomal protein L25
MAITLESKTRPEGSKPRALRRSGLIPANLYGHNGIESISLVLDAKVVERLLKQVIPNKTEVELSIVELEWTGTTVLREVQIHPAKGTPYHISFFAGAKA